MDSFPPHLPPIYYIYYREIIPVDSTRVNVHCRCTHTIAILKAQWFPWFIQNYLSVASATYDWCLYCNLLFTAVCHTTVIIVTTNCLIIYEYQPVIISLLYHSRPFIMLYERVRILLETTHTKL